MGKLTDRINARIVAPSRKTLRHASALRYVVANHRPTGRPAEAGVLKTSRQPDTSGSLDNWFLDNTSCHFRSLELPATSCFIYRHFLDGSWRFWYVYAMLFGWCIFLAFPVAFSENRLNSVTMNLSNLLKIIILLRVWKLDSLYRKKRHTQKRRNNKQAYRQPPKWNKGRVILPSTVLFWEN